MNNFNKFIYDPIEKTVTLYYWKIKIKTIKDVDSYSEAWRIVANHKPFKNEYTFLDKVFEFIKKEGFFMLYIIAVFTSLYFVTKFIIN